jgi:DNA mismatch repair protein MutL
MLLMAVRLAYGDTLPKGRYPVGWLSLQIPHEEVDVNVHPAKTEVRFVNPGGIKTWLQSTIHQFLWARGVKAAGWHMAVTHDPLDNEHGTKAHSLLTTPVHPVMPPARDMGHPLRILKGRDCHHLSTESSQRLIQSSSFADQKIQDGLRLHFEPHSAIPSPTCGHPNHSAFITSTPVATETTMVESVPTHPSSSHLHVLEPVDLGQAVAQIHHRYIVAKTASHLIIVDQHAAHERIVYEYIKTQWGQDLGHISPFLIPTQWDQDPALCDMIHQSRDILHTLGFTAEVRQDIVLLHSIPMIFQAYDPKELFLDLMSCIVEGDDAFKALERWRNHILANWACRHSIRGGDAMSIPSMNALLRKLEVTPNGAQCNHGRCVYRQWNSSGLSLFFQ